MFFLDTDAMSNGPYARMHLFKTSQIYNFKTRLGEICSSDVNTKGYSRFFDITAIEVYTVI